MVDTECVKNYIFTECFFEIKDIEKKNLDKTDHQFSVTSDPIATRLLQTIYAICFLSVKEKFNKFPA